MTDPIPLSAPSKMIRVIFCLSIKMLYFTSLKLALVWENDFRAAARYCFGQLELGVIAIHTIVDKLTARYPLASAHGHAQAGGAEPQAGQARKRPDPRATGGPLWVQSTIHQRPRAGSPQP